MRTQQQLPKRRWLAQVIRSSADCDTRLPFTRQQRAARATAKPVAQRAAR